MKIVKKNLKVKKCKGKMCAQCRSCLYFEDNGYDEGWCTIGPKMVGRNDSACRLFEYK